MAITPGRDAVNFPPRPTFPVKKIKFLDFGRECRGEGDASRPSAPDRI